MSLASSRITSTRNGLHALLSAGGGTLTDKINVLVRTAVSGGATDPWLEFRAGQRAGMHLSAPKVARERARALVSAFRREICFCCGAESLYEGAMVKLIGIKSVTANLLPSPSPR